MSIAISKKVKCDGARCPFSTFLSLQGDHHCACAQKWFHFSFFSRAFKQKKIKALRPIWLKQPQGVLPQKSFFVTFTSIVVIFHLFVSETPSVFFVNGSSSHDKLSLLLSHCHGLFFRYLTWSVSSLLLWLSIWGRGTQLSRNVMGKKWNQVVGLKGFFASCPVSIVFCRGIRISLIMIFTGEDYAPCCTQNIRMVEMERTVLTVFTRMHFTKGLWEKVPTITRLLLILFTKPEQFFSFSFVVSEVTETGSFYLFWPRYHEKSSVKVDWTECRWARCAAIRGQMNRCKRCTLASAVVRLRQ